VVTSGHVTKQEATPFDRHDLKHYGTPKHQGAILYRAGVIADRNLFYSRNSNAVFACRQPDLRRLHRLAGRGHFRSRDEDDRHTIRSAMAENSMLRTNIKTMSSTEPELLPIDFFNFRNANFAYFCENMGKYKNK